jgi:hypothetical protein
MQLFRKDLPDFRDFKRLFRKRMLPDFKLPPEEKKRSPFQKNLRKVIISRKPIVILIAKRVSHRIYSNKYRLEALGDSSLRRGQFQQAKDIYEGRHNWTGMAIAQMGLNDVDGAIKTLNERYLFSKRAAALFLSHIKELDKSGKCSTHVLVGDTKMLETLLQNLKTSDKKKSQKDVKTTISKAGAGEAKNKTKSIEGEELF